MNWKHRTKPTEKYGDKRIITKFLLFPMRIGDESRWFEIATIQQELIKVRRAVPQTTYQYDTGRWINKEFIN